MTSGGTNFTNFLENQIDHSVCLPFFTIEHEQVLRTDQNNSEIRYTKNYVFSWQGCVHTLLTPSVYATALYIVFIDNIVVLLSHEGINDDDDNNDIASCVLKAGLPSNAAQRTQRKERNEMMSLLDRPITAASDDGVCRWHAAKLWQTHHKIWNYWN